MAKPRKKPWMDQNVHAARLIAILAHRDQMYGNQPYVYHLDQVCNILGHFGYKGEMLQAAYLHDVLEDTNLTAADLSPVFEDRVIKLVEAVTGVGENRKARNADMYRKLARYQMAIPLKVADRIANIHSTITSENHPLFAMYRDESAEFEKHVIDTAPDRMAVEYKRLLAFKQPIDWLEGK